MSRGRFALLVTVLAMAAGVLAFALGLQVLDDDGPDAPPEGAGTASETTVAPLPTPSTTAPPATTPPGALETPAWIVIVSSEATEEEADADAAAVAAAGHPAGVLRSDDFPTLNPGLWVAYAGPYPDKGAAEAAVPALAEDGFGGAYVRCAGTKDECKGNDGDGGDSDDD
jgi:hypothetical protein